MTRITWAWLTLVLISTAFALVCATGLLPEPLQTAGLFWFLLICPGLAYVPLFQFGPPAIELLIALAASFALNTLVTLGLMLMGAWSMQTALLIMAGIAMLGVFLQLAQEWPALRRRLQ
jgi:hypothetical protein